MGKTPATADTCLATMQRRFKLNARRTLRTWQGQGQRSSETRRRTRWPGHLTNSGSKWDFSELTPRSGEERTRRHVSTAQGQARTLYRRP